MRFPVPAEVLTARVSAVTIDRAATRRERMRRRRGCGCMRGPFAPRQPPVSGCTLALTLCRRDGGRALEETDRGKAGPQRGESQGTVIVSQVTSLLSVGGK
ncbi:hypothetical protein GCM10010345_24110 [Streptomyces canarius]|uniref:Uncharacterized protein n=1 Tax=Streptomyces canarius TaxID=285453 RepID=A0ABQ3CKT0_9ACTN|nr:hypothetical protein GCM10010345_24110 [Streptomyces canarius]